MFHYSGEVAQERFIQLVLYYRNAERSLAEDVRKFLKDIERQTGAQLFVMAGFQKTDGKVAVTR